MGVAVGGAGQTNLILYFFEENIFLLNFKEAFCFSKEELKDTKSACWPVAIKWWMSVGSVEVWLDTLINCVPQQWAVVSTCFFIVLWHVWS